MGMSDPIERLPSAYASYLRLRAEGRSEAEISEALEVPVQSLGLVDLLARAKLARLEAEDAARDSPV